MTGVDGYLGRQFNRSAYNCLHFTRDVWLDLTGVDITSRLASVLNPESRRPTKELFRGFTRIPTPQNPCIILMQRAKSVSHLGVYIRGRVLHLHENGAEFQPVDVASRGFQSVRYYVC